MPYQEFSLDGAAILDSNNPQQRVIVYNINIPKDRTEDAQVYNTIRQQILADFPPQHRDKVLIPLYFQISAVYTLIHQTTNEERLWQGSFNPRVRNLGQVTAFRPLDIDTFVQYALVHCQPERVLHQLDYRINGKESVWSVGELLSVIISVQTTVRTSHPIFQQRLAFQPDNHEPENWQRPANRRRRTHVQKRKVFRLVFD